MEDCLLFLSLVVRLFTSQMCTDLPYRPFLRRLGITQESEITGPNASTTVPDFVTASIGDLRTIGKRA